MKEGATRGAYYILYNNQQVPSVGIQLLCQKSLKVRGNALPAPLVHHLCSTEATKNGLPVQEGLHIHRYGSLSMLGFTAVMQRNICSVTCVKSKEKPQQMPVELDITRNYRLEPYH